MAWLILNYFRTCLEIQICPKFLRFRPSDISAYNRPAELYKLGLKRKLEEVRKLENVTQKKYQFEKKKILSQLSLFEKTGLIHLLTKEFEKHAKSILETHFKKLSNLYREQTIRAPEAITNLKKKKLSIKEFHALRFGLEHPILPEKVKQDEIKTIWKN